MAAPVGENGVVGFALRVGRRDLGRIVQRLKLVVEGLRTPPLRATSTLTTSPGRRNPMICCNWPTVLRPASRATMVSQLDAGGLVRASRRSGCPRGTRRG